MHVRNAWHEAETPPPLLTQGDFTLRGVKTHVPHGLEGRQPILPRFSRGHAVRLRFARINQESAHHTPPPPAAATTATATATAVLQTKRHRARLGELVQGVKLNESRVGALVTLHRRRVQRCNHLLWEGHKTKRMLQLF